MFEVTMKNGKPYVELWDNNGCGIIFEAPTGVIYTNQTGGGICNHPEAEGFYVPCPDLLDRHWSALHALLCGYVWDDKPILSEEAIHYLERNIFPYEVMVDRGRLLRAEEAWIPVFLTSQSPNLRGWFTYVNCD